MTLVRWKVESFRVLRDECRGNEQVLCVFNYSEGDSFRLFFSFFFQYQRSESSNRFDKSLIKVNAKWKCRLTDRPAPSKFDQLSSIHHMPYSNSIQVTKFRMG